MCRVYSKQGQKYIRCCYRCAQGLRGQHIPFDGEPPLSPTGHYSVRASGRPPLRPGSSYQPAPAEQALCFAVPPRCPPEDVAAMARYAGAQSLTVGALVVLYRTAGVRRWRNVGGIVARAASFGWRPAELTEDLWAQVRAARAHEERDRRRP